MTIKTSILAGAAALALTAGAASAATVSLGGVVGPTAGNDFLNPGELGGLNFLQEATVTLDGPARLTFTLIAAESGNVNTFTSSGDSLVENNQAWNASGWDSFSAVFGGGAVSDLKFSSVGNLATPAEPGDVGFGVFYAGGSTSGLATFFLAYDDQGGRGDDNHDDMIVRVDVSAVPLPAAGWMLLAGLGGIAAMKRRKKA